MVIGYLLGSIPFGLILTRLAGSGDIRSVGSGNIGATNVLRTGRKGLAAATLLGDMLKGTAAVLLMRKIGGIDPALVAGLAAVLGHVFPVWLNFKGGKGVATYIGVLIAVSWPVALSFGMIWAVRCGAVALFVARRPDRERGHAGAAVVFRQAATPAWLFAILTALVWIMHRGNIARLMAGTEPKIGSKPSARCQRRSPIWRRCDPPAAGRCFRPRGLR